MPVPLARYALVALLGLALLLIVILLVRPLIFTFSDPRDDANYPLVATAELDAGPRVIEIVLNDRHGWPGEIVDGDRVGLTVIAAPVPGRDTYAVVDAWSPLNDCAITLGADRLVDCAGATWTYQGFPINNNAMAVTFPVDERQGALVVDFTQTQLQPQ